MKTDIAHKTALTYSKLDRSVIDRLLVVVLNRLEENNFLDTKSSEQLFIIVMALVKDFMSSNGIQLDRAVSIELVAQSIMDDLIGFGPLQPLLNDPKVCDILVNRYDEVFVEISGVLHRTDVVFTDDEHLLRIVRRMLAGLGKRIDESSPMVDARLADGSRINAIIPPLSLKGTALSIRKFQHDVLSEEALIEYGSVSREVLDHLIRAVKERNNIIISGGTGSGKTVLLNILSNHIAVNERVITIEDSAELHLQNDHVVSLETRPPNTEGIGEITTRMLLKNALRMRPDRIIVGESRGEEVLDMLQAMNTGHLGSMSTLHANSAQDAIVRLEMMLRMSDFKGTDGLIKQMIATSIDIVVHLDRDILGKRFISEIVSIKRSEPDLIKLTTLFKY